MVKFIKSNQEWTDLKKNDLVIVDFTASWCGPCKAITPVYEQLAKDNQNIVFVKVDVDEMNQLAAQEGVSAMPTFMSFVKGQKYREMRGADRNGLQELIKEAHDYYQVLVKRELRDKPVDESIEELQSKSIKELKAMIQERGLSLVGLSEKQDLILKLKHQI